MSSPAAAKPEKTMSSRLLTMKFMQRAAASAAAKDAQAGSDDNPPTPKRRRLSTENGSPATPQSDLDAIAAALAAEEEKRREAISRQAAEAGETQWVLDIPAATPSPAQPLVVAADSLDAEDDILQGGRRAYGNFKRKSKSTSQPAKDQENEESDSDDSDNGPTDPAGVEARIKKSKQKALAKAAKNKAKSKPGKDKLSNLTSISGSQTHRPTGGSNKKKKRKSQ